MSIISLSTYVDMSGAATPSSGIIMGLDLDGTLKQKGTSGAVTEIGSGGGGGSAGTSGSSGTRGTSGSSGTSGNTGATGVDGGNTLRWVYGDRGVNGEFEMTSTDFTLSSNDVYINYDSQVGDASSWLSSLADYITLFPGGAYLKISELNNSTRYVIYQVNSALNQTSYWSYNCSRISGNGSSTTGNEYSISWVIMGGNNGSSGTSVVMWLGELITDRGVGNGMSILIFTSIAASFPSQLWSIRLQKGLFAFFFIMAVGVLIVAADVIVIPRSCSCSIQSIVAPPS